MILYVTVWVLWTLWHLIRVHCVPSSTAIYRAQWNHSLDLNTMYSIALSVLRSRSTDTWPLSYAERPEYLPDCIAIEYWEGLSRRRGLIPGVITKLNKCVKWSLHTHPLVKRICSFSWFSIHSDT